MPMNPLLHPRQASMVALTHTLEARFAYRCRYGSLSPVTRTDEATPSFSSRSEKDYHVYITLFYFERLCKYTLLYFEYYHIFMYTHVHHFLYIAFFLENLYIFVNFGYLGVSLVIEC